MRRSFLTALLIVLAVALPAAAAITYSRQMAPAASLPAAFASPSSSSGASAPGGALGAPDSVTAAAAELEQAVALEPQNVEAWRYLSMAYRLQGRLDAAEEVWQRAQRANPSQSWPLVELGRLYAETGRTLEAHDAYFRAVRLDPQDVAANESFERSAAALTGLQAMQEYMAGQAAGPGARTILVNQTLPNGWTYVGYAAGDDLLRSEGGSTLWSFWRAPGPDIKPSLSPDLWQPTAGLWVNASSTATLLPGGDFESAISGNLPAAFPGDLYSAAPGTRQLRRITRDGSETTAGALINDPANRSTSYVSRWLPVAPDTAYLVAADALGAAGNPAVGWRWDGDIAAEYGTREQYAQPDAFADGWQHYAGLAAPPPGAARLRVQLLNTATTGLALFDDAALLPVPLPAPLYPGAASAAEQRQAQWQALEAQLLRYPAVIGSPQWQAEMVQLGPLVSVQEEVQDDWTLLGYSTNEAQLARGDTTPLVLYWQGPAGAVPGALGGGWVDLQGGAWLQVLPAAASITAGGDFEEGFDPWPGDIFGAPAAARQLTVTVRSGYTTTVAALVNSATYTSSSLIAELQPITPDTIYLQAGWLRSQGGRGYIGRFWYGDLAPEEQGDSYIVGGGENANWAHYAGVAVPPAGSAEVEVWLLNYESEGTAYFDDLILAPVPAPYASAGGLILLDTGSLIETGALTDTGTLTASATLTGAGTLTDTGTLEPSPDQARLLNFQYQANGALVGDEGWLSQVAAAGPAYGIDQDVSPDWTLAGFTADEESLAGGATAPVFYFWRGPAAAVPGNAAGGWYSLDVGYWLQIDSSGQSLLPNGDLELPPDSSAAAAFPLDAQTGQPASDRVQRSERGGFVTTALVLAGDGSDGSDGSDAGASDSGGGDKGIGVSSAGLPIDPARLYLLSGSLRVEGGSGQLGVQWSSEGLGSAPVTRLVAFNVADTDWRQMAGLLTPPTGASAAAVIARNVQGGGKVLFDDLILLPVVLPAAPAPPTATATATATPTTTPTAGATRTPVPTVTATRTGVPSVTATRTPASTVAATRTRVPTATATRVSLPTGEAGPTEQLEP